MNRFTATINQMLSAGARITTASPLLILAAALPACFIAATPGHAQHPGDIYVTHEGGQILTGIVNSDSTITVPTFVFKAVFGDSGFEGFTSDPGFDAPAGTFTPGYFIGFNVRQGLKVWNGDGFDPVDGDAALHIWFGPLEVIVEDDPIPGFELAVQPNGGWHRHLNYQLLGASGEPVPGDPVDPGIFLLELELYSTDPAIPVPSEPFWKVFNYKESAAVHDLAVTWVEENLVGGEPCPGDLNGDGQVNGADLGILLANWGPCEDTEDCPADLNGDGQVNGADLGILLANWGACP